jgi:Uma2 family endonuclease
MNIQARYPTTPDEFLRWPGEGDNRWEFVAGEPVRLPRDATQNHARIASRLVFILSEGLAWPPFSVGTATFGIRTRDGVRFPDVFVDCEDVSTKGTNLTATAPVIIAEILSAWSRDRDFGEKVIDYTRLSTLEHYIVLSQDEARIWLWSRGEDEAWLNPQTFARADGPVQLAGLGITLDLDRLYAGVVPQDKPN